MVLPVARSRTVMRVPSGRYHVAQRPGMKLYQVAMPTRKSRAFERLMVVVVVDVVLVVDVLEVEVVEVVGSPGYVVGGVDVVVVVEGVDVVVAGLGLGLGLGFNVTLTAGLGRVR